nr:uncharacterized protein LOC129255489 [Lytechinus pictus]
MRACPSKTKVLLYKTLILPVLEYAAGLFHVYHNKVHSLTILCIKTKLGKFYYAPGKSLECVGYSRNEILFKIHKLSMKDICNNFEWIPSHCDVNGNEIVDKAAKKGAAKIFNRISQVLLQSLDRR